MPLLHNDIARLIKFNGFEGVVFDAEQVGQRKVEFTVVVPVKCSLNLLFAAQELQRRQLVDYLMGVKIFEIIVDSHYSQIDCSQQWLLVVELVLGDVWVHVKDAAVQLEGVQVSSGRLDYGLDLSGHSV